MRLAAVVLLLLAAACGTIREALAPAPQGRPSGREGWLVYGVGGLSFEAPATWSPGGTPRHLRLEAPDGVARLEVSTPDALFKDEAACLASAEEIMKRGASLERVRRHPTKFAGVRAETLEGDAPGEGGAPGWHVWAWAACAGGVQYQVFFTARTPPAADVLDAYRTLGSSARIEAVPSA